MPLLEQAVQISGEHMLEAMGDVKVCIVDDGNVRDGAGRGTSSLLLVPVQLLLAASHIKLL